MAVSSVITARLDPDTLALVDRVSKAHGRSRSWFAAQAIKQAAEQEAEILSFVQEGIDAIERGDVVPHEEVEKLFDEMIERQRARRK